MVTRRAATSATNGKRTRRGPFTRQQILDASLSLFSQRGFARTTVRDIARKAGITDAAIYYHFDSKRELLGALVEERGFLAGLAELEQVEPIVPVEEAVQWHAAGAVNMMDQNRDFLRLIIMEGLGGDEAALEQYTLLMNLWEKALTAVFGRYAARGEIGPESAPELATQVPYLILAAFQDSLLGRHGFAGSAEERQAALCTFLGPTLARIVRGHLV
ncbi:MAG TPA: TetR/AcrR family transcriptional regulator [Dehalococcoidia bacterium]|nr:TetR/AcrR family transcriptional regulator [Dehalococcoidia bacterium]